MPTLSIPPAGDGPRARATRSSWRTKPIPLERARLALERRFDRGEWEALKLGFVPQTMEDKWFVFEDGGWLYFHRSWTGYGVYWVRLAETPSGGEITEAWVSREKSQYKGDREDDDVRRLSQLIDMLCARDSRTK